MKEILLAGVIALIFSFFGTPALIKLLARHGYGQMIRDDGPQSHHSKRGTPTMGGIAIILSTIVGYVAAHLILGITFSASAILVIALFTGLGLVGFIDDYLKVIKARSLGLNSKQKIIGQVLVAGLFGYFGTKFLDEDGLAPISLHLSFLRDTSIKLGWIFSSSQLFGNSRYPITRPIPSSSSTPFVRIALASLGSSPSY